MKNAVLTLTFILACLGSLAQDCNPDTTIKDPGIYPEYVDTAFIDVPFEHVFQILAVRDTTVTIGNSPVAVQIDSIIIVEIIGLPGDFDYQCNPVNCVYTYEDVGCAKLSGNPVAADIGTHPLEIVVTSYAKWGQLALDQTDTLRDYTILVLDSTKLGINESDAGIGLYPNPNQTGLLEIRSLSAMVSVDILDLNGRLVFQKNTINSRHEELDISLLGSGLHIVRIQTEQGVISKKLMLLD